MGAPVGAHDIPPDSESPHTAELLAWKVKIKSNDELRQWFVDLAVPQAQAMGLEMPDPDLRQDEESGHWLTGKIDWEEFKQFLAGNGPCNRDRLEARRKAHDEGAWVREAAMAHEAKRNQRLSA